MQADIIAIAVAFFLGLGVRFVGLPPLVGYLSRVTEGMTRHCTGVGSQHQIQASSFNPGKALP